MDFYSALAEHYDDIFPLKEAQKKFLVDYLTRESLATILDIGCGTGTFALETSNLGVKVHGVDISPEMIGLAKEKAQELGSKASFSVADMRDLSSISEQFEGIYCLGNTLAHVSGDDELKQVLAQFKTKANRLLIQIVNYDRIMAQQIKELPVIRTDRLVFYRYYTHRSDNKIEFAMKIEFPDTGQIVSGVNLLYPIKLNSLKRALAETGWKVSELWGNFAKDPWTENSPATVLEARY